MFNKQQQRSFSLVFIIALFIGCQQEDDNKQVVRNSESNFEIDFNEIVTERMAYATEYGIKEGEIPRSLEEDGSIRGVQSKDWTSGFYPGNLWLAYHLTSQNEYLDLARDWTALVEKEKNNAGTHDMGFKIMCSFGNGYEITGDNQYRQVIISAANTLITRYDSTVRSIKSWDWGSSRGWRFPVIIDNMMNLELLYQATALTGDSTYYNIATQHAETTLKNHFRPDHSSYHVVDFNPETGNVISKFTHQGFSDESAWARGQAWGLYGFTMTFRETGDQKFLDQARKIAGFILNNPNLPADKVPYWDFSAPAIPDAPRDVSAAAIISSALFELADLTGNEGYRNSASEILRSLSTDNYLTDKSASHPFILTQAVGNKPQDDEVSVPISYADYYYLEAVLRMLKKDI